MYAKQFVLFLKMNSLQCMCIEYIYKKNINKKDRNKCIEKGDEQADGHCCSNKT